MKNDQSRLSAFHERLLNALCERKRGEAVSVRELEVETGNPEDFVRRLLVELGGYPHFLTHHENGGWVATPYARNTARRLRHEAQLEAQRLPGPVSADALSLLLSLATRANMAAGVPDDFPMRRLRGFAELEQAGYVSWVDDESIALTPMGLARATRIVSDAGRQPL